MEEVSKEKKRRACPRALERRDGGGVKEEPLPAAHEHETAAEEGRQGRHAERRL